MIVKNVLNNVVLNVNKERLDGHRWNTFYYRSAESGVTWNKTTLYINTKNIYILEKYILWRNKYVVRILYLNTCENSGTIVKKYIFYLIEWAKLHPNFRVLGIVKPTAIKMFLFFFI